MVQNSTSARIERSTLRHTNHCSGVHNPGATARVFCEIGPSGKPSCLFPGYNRQRSIKPLAWRAVRSIEDCAQVTRMSHLLSRSAE